MRIFVLILLLGSMACKPQAGLSVKAEAGGGHRVEFLNCSRPSQLLPLKRLAVHRKVAGKADELVCSLRPNDYATLTGSWHYGDSVEDYELQGCTPLLEGETYSFAATLAPYLSVGTLVTIGRGGAVARTRGGCE